MRLRSTGLGRTELVADIKRVEKVDDLVIFFTDVTTPVKWHARMGFQEKDLRALVWALLKPKNMAFILKAMFFGSKEVTRTEDF